MLSSNIVVNLKIDKRNTERKIKCTEYKHEVPGCRILLADIYVALSSACASSLCEPSQVMHEIG